MADNETADIRVRSPHENGSCCSTTRAVQVGDTSQNEPHGPYWQVQCLILWPPRHYPQKSGNILLLSSSVKVRKKRAKTNSNICLLYTSPSPRDGLLSRM